MNAARPSNGQPADAARRAHPAKWIDHRLTCSPRRNRLSLLHSLYLMFNKCTSCTTSVLILLSHAEGQPSQFYIHDQKWNANKTPSCYIHLFELSRLFMLHNNEWEIIAKLKRCTGCQVDKDIIGCKDFDHSHWDTLYIFINIIRELAFTRPLINKV